jgi:DnaJ-class molecular chaperone
MAEDFYKTLGVGRDASQSDIQKAYRDLARKYHPDLNPDKAAKKKFQEVQRAFDVLNDAGKRELYDRYGSSFEHVQAAQERGGGTAWGHPGGSAEEIDFSQLFGDRFGGGAAEGFGDIFSQFRRASARSRGRAAPHRGEDLHAQIEVPFTKAVMGGETQLSIERGSGKIETITVKLPAGIADGQEMRLRGQGIASPGGGEAGDLLLRVNVAEHPCFERRQNNLYVKVPVTLGEAAAGAKVDVPTPYGTVALRVPPGTSSGKKLRIRGQGIRPKKGDPGDLFAEIQIVLPDGLSDASREVLRQFDRDHPQEPRRDLKW